MVEWKLHVTDQTVFLMIHRGFAFTTDTQHNNNYMPTSLTSHTTEKDFLDAFIMKKVEMIASAVAVFINLTYRHSFETKRRVPYFIACFSINLSLILLGGSQHSERITANANTKGIFSRCPRRHKKDSVHSMKKAYINKEFYLFFFITSLCLEQQDCRLQEEKFIRHFVLFKFPCLFAEITPVVV